MARDLDAWLGARGHVGDEGGTGRGWGRGVVWRLVGVCVLEGGDCGGGLEVFYCGFVAFPAEEVGVPVHAFSGGVILDCVG